MVSDFLLVVFLWKRSYSWKLQSLLALSKLLFRVLAFFVKLKHCVFFADETRAIGTVLIKLRRYLLCMIYITFVYEYRDIYQTKQIFLSFVYKMENVIIFGYDMYAFHIGFIISKLLVLWLNKYYFLHFQYSVSDSLRRITFLWTLLYILQEYNIEILNLNKLFVVISCPSQPQ